MTSKQQSNLDHKMDQLRSIINDFDSKNIFGRFISDNQCTQVIWTQYFGIEAIYEIKFPKLTDGNIESARDFFKKNNAVFEIKEINNTDKTMTNLSFSIRIAA